MILVSKNSSNTKYCKEITQNIDSINNRSEMFIIEDQKSSVLIPVQVYRPENIGYETKVLFSMHGVHRNAKKARDIFIDSMHGKAIVIAPSFKDMLVARSTKYNLGNILSSVDDTVYNPRSEWTFRYIDEIFEIIREELALVVNKFSIFGHSAGAQYVHRMAIFHQSPYVNEFVAANAGWYTAFDNNRPFPFGINNLLSDGQTKDSLAKNLTIIAGEDDRHPDPVFRRSKDVSHQGDNRYVRAKYFYNLAKDYAETHNCSFNWRFISAPGLKHDARMAAKIAPKYLFDRS